MGGGRSNPFVLVRGNRCWDEADRFQMKFFAGLLGSPQMSKMDGIKCSPKKSQAHRGPPFFTISAEFPEFLGNAAVRGRLCGRIPPILLSDLAISIGNELCRC